MISSTLAQANNWFAAERFSMTPAKTLSITCSLQHAAPANEVQILGFHIDPKLTWSAHIFTVRKNLARALFLIKKLKWCDSGLSP
jgi:hypothetical protein